MRVAETPLVIITIGLREDWSRKAEGVLREGSWLMSKPNSIVIFTGRMKEVMGLGCLFLKRGGAWNPIRYSDLILG